MIKITYINGDVQSVNVDDSFFTTSVAPKNGKKTWLTPAQKAIELASECSRLNKLDLSQIEIVYPNGKEPSVMKFREVEAKECIQQTGSFDIKKKFRNMFKNVSFTASEKLVF